VIVRWDRALNSLIHGQELPLIVSDDDLNAGRAIFVCRFSLQQFPLERHTATLQR
jgi:hypothetical protein